MRDGGSLHVDAMDTLGATNSRDGASAFVEEPVTRKDGNGADGRPTPSSGTVFVLAGGGVRHMGRFARDAAADGTFLDYPLEDLFWRDLLDLVHPDESEGFGALISDVKASPGTSASVRLRLLDGLGRWRPAETTVLNVIEAPDGLDGGLLVVNVRDLSRPATA